jgi:hypothetical protein
MDVSGPKRLTWWLALIIWAGVILGAIGILAQVLPIAALAGSAFWVLAIGYALLAIAAAFIYLTVLPRPNR